MATRLIEILPFIDEFAAPSRRELFDWLYDACPELGDKPFGRITADELAACGAMRRFADRVAGLGTEESLDWTFGRLVPRLRSSGSRFLDTSLFSARTRNILRDNHLTRWRDISRLTLQSVLDLDGAGETVARELLSSAIQKGLAPSPHGELGPPWRAELRSSLRSPNGDYLESLLHEETSRLPIGSLAAPVFSGGLRARLLAFQDKVQLQDVVRFLTTRDSQLGRVFNTEKRHADLVRAMSYFDGCLFTWALGDLWDSKLKWLLPNGSLRTRNLAFDDHSLRIRLEAAGPFGRHICTSPDVGMWLPLLSIEGILALARLRAPDVPNVLGALAIGSRRLGQDKRSRPWERHFSRRLMALPLYWLYQYAPEPRTETVLRRLTRGGFTNVGHLRMLHPVLLRLVGESDTKDWISLRTALARR